MAKKDKAGVLDRALKEFRWSFIVTALVFIILGVFLILRPHTASTILVYVVGAALTVYGVFNILSFLFARERALSFELVMGVITAAVGVFALASPATVEAVIQILLGLVIVIDSLLGMKRAFALRDLDLPSWGVMLILSLITAVFGVLFIVNKSLFGPIHVLMIVIGVVLLYQGISDLVTVIRISVIGKRLRKDLGLMVRDEIVIDPDDQ